MPTNSDSVTASGLDATNPYRSPTHVFPPSDFPETKKLSLVAGLNSAAVVFGLSLAFSIITTEMVATGFGIPLNGPQFLVYLYIAAAIPFGYAVTFSLGIALVVILRMLCILTPRNSFFVGAGLSVVLGTVAWWFFDRDGKPEWYVCFLSIWLLVLPTLMSAACYAFVLRVAQDRGEGG